MNPIPSIELCEERVAYLIAEHPSGCHISAQAGGVACSHPSVVGYVVAVTGDSADVVGGLEQAMCDLGCGCAPLRRVEDIATANEVLGDLRWACLHGVEDLRIDTERLAECTEGWWRVVWRQAAAGGTALVEFRGVVAGPNCD